MAEAQKVQSLANQMLIRMGRSYQCFLLYKALAYKNNSDIHEIGIIERNNFVFNRHNDFFVPVSDSLLTKAIIDLYIFFGTDKNNFNYTDLLNELKSKCHHKTYEDLNKTIEDLFHKVRQEKEYLTNFRHGSLAHDGKNKKSHELTLEHIETLFLTTQEVFNLISHHLDNSSADFNIYNEREAMSDVDSLFRELDFGYKEFVRILKIEEKHDLSYKNKTSG